MRDIKRIDGFCNNLAKEWKKYPDLRFGQFCIDFLGWLYSEKDTDGFYPEDDEMMEYIREFVEKNEF